MFIPVRTDTPLRRTPYMNYALIFVTVIAFIVQKTMLRGAVLQQLQLQPRDPRLWQFFSYQFLHGDILHLLGNMLFLYIFGNNVNDKLGNFGYLGFYLAGGVFAGVADVALRSDSWLPTVGASGSIMAVTGSYLVLLPYSRVTVFYFFYLIGTFEISGLWLVLAYFLLDLYEQFGRSSGGQPVAHMAHIGGTVFGFVVCMSLLGGRLLPRDMWDLFAILDRWNRRRQHRDAVARGYDPFGYTPRETRTRPDPMAERIQDLRATISESIAQNRLPDAVRQYLELRAIDPNQVMSRQTQLDIANQLFSDGLHPAAADSYELYLRTYPKADQVEHVQLMLGIIYARYLNRFDRAKELLTLALPRLHAARDLELAKSELERIEPLIGKPV